MIRVLLSVLLFFSCGSLLSQEVGVEKQVLDAHIIPFMNERNIKGLAVALYVNDQEYIYTYGSTGRPRAELVSPQTIFEIGSITKVFTSTELALQVQQGRMKLNDPVSRYLPILKEHHAPIFTVTLQELATHTSSLPRIPPKRFRNNYNEIMTFLSRWHPEHPPGSHYLYSNIGFGILGYALSNLHKIAFYPLIRRDILEPLGMNSTVMIVPYSLSLLYAQGFNPQGKYAPRWKINPWPAGGALRSTAADMLIFLKANLGLTGPQNLIDAMQFAQQPLFKVNDNLTLGLGWQRFKKDETILIDKNGGTTGFSSYISLIPEKKMGIVLLANKSKTQITQIGRQILLDLVTHKQVQ